MIVSIWNLHFLWNNFTIVVQPSTNNFLTVTSYQVALLSVDSLEFKYILEKENHQNQNVGPINTVRSFTNTMRDHKV